MTYTKVFVADISGRKSKYLIARGMPNIITFRTEMKFFGIKAKDVNAKSWPKKFFLVTTADFF